jgi:glutamyl-tRNA reductase
MRLLALSLNHMTAPLPLRERVAFPAERLLYALSDLRRRLYALVPESAILSTCNRTELYCVVSDPAEAHRALVGWLANGTVPAERLHSHLRVLPQHDAVRHAFRVASGLDSMVLGEPQILGQMKQAARHAQQAGVLGTQLHQLFQRAFSVAKAVRSQTDIGAGAVSMAAATVRLAQGVFDDLRDTRVLLVGAGEMVELAATHFAAQRPRALVVANRTIERAERIARRFCAESMRLAELPRQLHRFDVLVSCTASSLPIIGLGMLQRVHRLREGKPIVMVDLAVPQDIEPEVGRLPGVILYDVDDLGRMMQSGMSSRLASVAQAETIIETGVDAFMHWLASRRAVPLLRSLDQRAGRMRATELERARRLLARGQSIDAVLEALALGLSNKFLHAPRSLLAGGAMTPEEGQRLIEAWAGKAARAELSFAGAKKGRMSIH